MRFITVFRKYYGFVTDKGVEIPYKLQYNSFNEVKIMKIGILGAMEREVKWIYERLDDAQIVEKCGCKFYCGKLSGKEVVILQCGVGKVNAALGAQNLFNHFGITHLINSGIAGAMASGLGIFDFVVSDELFYHDIDVTQFGYKIGQVPGQEPSFKADPVMIEAALKAFPRAKSSEGHKIIKGRIASGDQFISGGERKEFIRKTFDPACVEMEGCAVAHAATINKIPFIVVRCMSDMADDNIETVYNFTEDDAAKVSADFVEEIIKDL